MRQGKRRMIKSTHLCYEQLSGAHNINKLVYEVKCCILCIQKVKVYKYK